MTTTVITRIVFMSYNENSISPAELRVLSILWNTSPLSASDIAERLHEVETWHSRTIKTLLTRLVKKKFVGFKEDGNRYLYYPLIAQQEYQQKMSRNFIQRVFGGRLSPLVAQFAKHETVSKEDIEELKAILNDLEST